MKNYFFLLVLFSLGLKAQTIKGTISDSTGVVPFVNVLVKKIDNPNLVFQYTSTNDEGFFKIILKDKPELLIIEFTSLAHESKTIFLKDAKFENNETNINIFLSERITKLKDIILEKKVSIQVKKDTVTYDPNSFKDGSEKVVEDLLKKLPGIEVKDDGEIKYKGKSIKKLLLDGDDLFDSQYKIGSKNINIDMIEKVQGIDHFEENSLLKGIRDSDEVALNLILKKGKTDLSGNANLGYGYESNLENSLSAILVNSKIKGFGIASHNNIGQNNTPYDIESDFQSFDRTEDKYAKTLIDQGYFNSVLESKFHRLNNNFFVNSNFLLKIRKKSAIKINLGFYDDKLTRTNQNSTYINLNNENFSFNEQNYIKKKPVLYDAKVYFSNKEKDFFHWDYLGKINYSTTNYNDFSINNTINQNNFVQTKSFFMKQNINSTYKIGKNTVIISKIDFTKSDSPQELNINPGTNLYDDIISSNQQSKFDNQSFNFKTSLLSKKDSIKYAIHTEFLTTKSKLFSSLLNEQNNPISNIYENDNLYKCNILSIKPVFVYNKKKYSYKIGLNTFLSKINYIDYINSNNIDVNEIVFSPTLNLNLKLSKKANIISSYSYNAILPEEDKLFTGIVQNNYRSFTNNSLSLDLLKTHSYQIGYNYNDFFNFRRININFNHDYRPNNYFSNTLINQNITVNNLFLDSLSSKDYNFNFGGEIYFHPLKTTFQLNTNYTFSFNKNIVNNSEIRDINSKTLYSNLICRTKIIESLTLENNFSYSKNTFKVNDDVTNFQRLTYKTKIIIKPIKDIQIINISNLISPNLNQKNNYWFLESEINYNPKNKSYGFSIIAKNLTNNKTFETLNISDFSTTKNSHNLIERYVMTKVFFSF